MLRNVAALFAGIIVAMVVVAGIEWLSHLAFTPPAGLDLSDNDALREYAESIPAGAILLVGLAWVCGAFAGSLVAGKLGTLDPRFAAATITGLILAGAIFNLAVIPHPLWFTVLAPLAVIAAGLAAWKLLARNAA